MTTKEVFRAQLSHIMGLLVESVVREMGRLLDECAAVLDGQEDSLLKIEMERVNTINTVNFESFMEELSRSSMEQISLLLNIEEVDVTAVERTDSEAVISVDPEVKSGIVIIDIQQEIRKTVGTQNVAVKEEGSSFESDNQEEDPQPTSDEEWLPGDDPSKNANNHLQVPSSTRLNTPRLLSDPGKQDPSRSEEDPEVQCGDSADAVHKASLICSQCGKCFKKKYDLTRHFQTHTKPYNCSHCGKGFNLAKRLEEHAKKHTGTREGLANPQKTLSREKKYCCESCGKMFFTTWCLKAHMTIHKPKEHSCTVCGQSFNNGNALRKHRLVSHPGETPSFICDVCGKCFAKRDHLYKHMLRHKEEKPYSCDVCGKRFHSSSNCKRHKMTHTGEKLYSCEICGKRFTQSGTMLKHKISKHTDGREKPFKCEICSEVCSSDYTLRNHMVTHTGKKPCHCSVCGKGFFNKQALKIHSLVHSGEKPYGCGQCGKRFSQPSHLKYHEHHVHTVVKACVCDICGKAYANRQNLKLHKCTAPAKPKVF
ncbi:oocyte zinc finger protein XlCOF6-like [Esox lucius]|uniref:oocyte zinc finger protein XlCOF6-like n=1 Tax=Esox lucius TaxID=8010 RepID=UPI001476C5EE|nr:oocyte zinc finger protein XlCOF6-like [Esox lucius]